MLDFTAFCEDGSMIIDKNGVSVPFKLNEAQLEVSFFLLREIFMDIPSPINLFIHKSRQMGISVVIGKIEQYICTRIRNLNCQHLMPTEQDADDLCDKKFIPLLQGTHPTLMPVMNQVKRRVKFVEFDNIKLGSTVTFSSAQQQAPGHGQTNQVVIEDEHAFYERVERLERGMLATMPKVGRALRVVVSTANGLNHFSDLSEVAKKSAHWKYLFLPWHMLKEYEMEPVGRLANLTNLTPYEVKLCDIFEAAGYPVSSWARKMQWWQYTFETEAKMDIDHMYSNYPSTPEESFSATGSPILPEDKLREMRDTVKKFQYVELAQRDNKVEIVDCVVSTMKQWEKPVPGRKYYLAVDPADGGADGDFSAAAVVDMTTMQTVWALKEKIDQNELAELLNHVGRYYNNAWIIPERNTGQSLIDWLTMLNYPLIWVDALATTKNRVVYGVYMTRPVKNEAITRAKFLINSGVFKDYDHDFIDEALHFTWKKTPSGLSKAVGTEGWHDDAVMCRLILMAALDMNKYKGYNTYLKDTANAQGQ